MSQDDRMIAAALTIATTSARSTPIPIRTSDGKIDTQIIFDYYKSFLTLLEVEDRGRREPGTAQ